MSTAAEVTTCWNNGTCVREDGFGREVKRWHSPPSLVLLTEEAVMRAAGYALAQAAKPSNGTHWRPCDFPDKGPQVMVPFVASSATSRAAAAEIEPHAGALELRVLACIEAAGAHGRTCDEVEQLLNMSHQTASARVKGLLDGERIYRTERTRPTRSGRAASVLLASGVAPELF